MEKTSTGMPCNVVSVLFRTANLSEETQKDYHDCELGCRYFGTHLSVIRILTTYFLFTVEPGYNDVALYDTSPITSHILWYQLIPHC